jgi:type I restriction enzyme S subunit
MTSEWKEVRLGEVCEIRRGSSPRPIVDFISRTKGIPWVKIADATASNSRFIKRTNQFLKEEGVGRSVVVKKGDLILSNSGTAGLPKFIHITACIHDGWQVLRELKGIDKDYLYYTLIYIRPALLHNAYDSTMKNLTLDMVRDAKIKLPPLSEQKQIAHVLVSLDDKIELNRQTNETLEQMAQALFKSWFVDFDPVIDNALAAGHPIPDELQERAQRRQQQLAKPDHKPLPDDIRQLFPSEFELIEELDWIPKGWESANIGKSFQLLSGHPFKSKDYLDDGDYGVVTIRNVQDGSFVQECANQMTDIPEKMKPHCKLDRGDVLLSLTGNVGRVCIVSSGRYLLNQRVAKIQGNDSIPRSMAYFFFRQKDLYKMMINIAKGTAQLNLSPIETLVLKHVMPSNKFFAEISAPFEAIFDKILNNTAQSQALTKLRDTLLPKLISGELRPPSGLPSAVAHQLVDTTLKKI